MSIAKASPGKLSTGSKIMPGRPLKQAKEYNLSYLELSATNMDKPLYERLGFIAVKKFRIYEHEITSDGEVIISRRN